jgi:hypothetical protein
MNGCQVLPLDPGKRRKTQQEELPSLSAMNTDGVMYLPVERRQADIHDCEEMHERRQRRAGGG